MKLRNIAIALGLLVFALSASAKDLTAFQLIKEGNRYVGEGVKDEVVQIRSDKSVGSLTPNIWYIVYYDTDATFHATEVKFGGGEKMEVKRPMRVLELGTKDGIRLNRKKMNTDSDKALAIALKDPLLKGLTLKASQMWLDQTEGNPVWRVRLWAAKLHNPNDDADIGQIYIQADDSAVIQRDLHIDRVN